MSAGTYRGEVGGVKTGTSCLTWVLGVKSRPSVRVVHALTVGPSLQLKHFEEEFSGW